MIQYSDLKNLNRSSFHQYKVAMIGPYGAGKSSFIMRYVNNKFILNIESTTGIDFLSSKKNIKGKIIKLDIWDTSGQQKYRSICNMQLNKVPIVIILYDLCLLHHLDNIQKEWIPLLKEKVQPNSLVYLFGNKEDLARQMKDYKEHLAAVKNKIEEIKKIYPNFINGGEFIGSCKDEQNQGITVTMNQLHEDLFGRIIFQQQKQRQQQNLKQKQSVLPKPPKTKSITIAAQDFNDQFKDIKTNDKNGKKKKKTFRICS